MYMCLHAMYMYMLHVCTCYMYLHAMYMYMQWTSTCAYMQCICTCYMYLHAMYITYVLLLLSAVIEFMGKAGGHLGGSNCNIPQIHLLI